MKSGKQQSFTKKVMSFFQRDKDQTSKNQIQQARKAKKQKKRLEKEPSPWALRKHRRKSRYDNQDIPFVSGQARIAARYFRKLNTSSGVNYVPRYFQFQ